MNYDIIACPFCHDGEITIRTYGGVWQEKRSSTATFGRTISKRKSRTDIIVETDCPKCGKTAEEIERML